jgi:hypothetical protein
MMPPVSIDMRVIARLVGEAAVSGILLVVAIFLMYSKLPDWMKFVFLLPTIGAPTFLVVAAGVRYLLGGVSDIEITKDRVALSGLRFKDLADAIARGVDFLRPRPRPLARPAGVIGGDHNPADPKNVLADPGAASLPLTIEVGEATVPSAAAAVAAATTAKHPASS